MPGCTPPRLAPDTLLLPVTGCVAADYFPTSSTCACSNRVLRCHIMRLCRSKFVLLHFLLLSYISHVILHDADACLMTRVTHKMRQGTWPELYMLADDM